jgi:type I restriction enzyme M protein
MPDVNTIEKIEQARNILVGVVPSPQSQVDQITYALIYKFLYDMDQEAINQSGKLYFFTDDYEKFTWSNLLSPRISGYELHSLYSDALNALPQNPHLPPFIRSIFRSALLPYRNPETLKLFLKKINEFQYVQNDHLGDAFEYLLQKLGS